MHLGRLLLKSLISAARPKDVSFCLPLQIFCFVCIAHKVGQSDIYCSFSQDHLSHNSKTYWEWIPPHQWYKTFKEFWHIWGVYFKFRSCTADEEIELHGNMSMNLRSCWWLMATISLTHIRLMACVAAKTMDDQFDTDTCMLHCYIATMISLILTLACYNNYYRSWPILCLCRYPKNCICFLLSGFASS